MCWNSLSSSSRRWHYEIRDRKWWKVKTFYKPEAAPSTLSVCKCGAFTVLRGSLFVFSITQIDVNSIPPGSSGHSGSLGSTATSAWQKYTNKKYTNNRTARSYTFRPFFFSQFIFTSLYCCSCYCYDGAWDLSIPYRCSYRAYDNKILTLDSKVREVRRSIYINSVLMVSS